MKGLTTMVGQIDPLKLIFFPSYIHKLILIIAMT